MRIKHNIRTLLLLSVGCLVCFSLSAINKANAITAIPDPAPVTNSYGLEATKTQPPPTEGATITSPSNGAAFSTSPTTVSGICPSGLLVEVYDNNVMVGAVNCTGGSFSVSVSLFDGENQLTATDYDNLDQSGPATNTVTVTYNDSHLTSFASLITLTSSYGREAADIGTPLNWPIQLAGGTGPYALSINWGDSATNQLKSVSLAGQIMLTHTYSSAGIYHVTIQATDVNSNSAFLQLVAVANGAAAAGSSKSGSNTKGAAATTTSPMSILPTIICLVLMIPIFILGRRSQMISLRKKLDKDMREYADQKSTP